MTPPATSPATHRPGTFAGAVPRTGPVARCPACAAELNGGPVAYWCGTCGRGVMAADLDISYHPPGPARAGAIALGGLT